jgi:hypothetical protein
MLTLRFEAHSNNPTSDDLRYQVYQCDKYNVSTERYSPQGEAEQKSPETAPIYKVVRMFRTISDTDAFFEYVGPRDANRVCYVMNAQGKTIDTIR